MASITVTPASGSITAAKTVVRVNVSGADANDASGFDADLHPSEPEMRYYLTFELAGQDTGKSYVFNVSADGDHVFNNYMFPAAGTWTVRLNDASDDSSVATASVVVA